MTEGIVTSLEILVTEMGNRGSKLVIFASCPYPFPQLACWGDRLLLIRRIRGGGKGANK